MEPGIHFDLLEWQKKTKMDSGFRRNDGQKTSDL